MKTARKAVVVAASVAVTNGAKQHMIGDQKLSTAELLYGCASQMGLSPVWLVPLDTFAITVAGKERYVNLARSPLNSDASAGLAKDKFVTRLVLERHGMANIPFALPRTQAAAAIFLAEHGTIVAKPVTGAGARDIHVITDRSQLEQLKITKYILEKYVAGKEMRYLILNGRVIGVHHSDYGTSVEHDRPLRRISYPKALWKPALVTASLRIADMMDLKFAAIDYLVDGSGKAYVLEVNTMPGLKWFHAPSSGPIVDVARLFMESFVNDMAIPVIPATDIVIAPVTVAYN